MMGKTNFILKNIFMLSWLVLVFLVYPKTNGQDIIDRFPFPVPPPYINSAVLILSSEQHLCGTFSICCTHSHGCFDAIKKGQAGFYEWLFFPRLPRITASDLGGMGTTIGCRISANLDLNRNLTAEEAFNCEFAGEDTKGKVSNMGRLYASIWWEIYIHEETSVEDIIILFSEHLPLISEGDTFRTIAVKIIDKARELFEGSRGEQYARIIDQEFTERGLTPLYPAVE